MKPRRRAEVIPRGAVKRCTDRMKMPARAEIWRQALTPAVGRRVRVASNAGLGAAVGVLVYKHLVGPQGLWAATWPAWLAILLVAAVDRGLLGALFPMTRAIETRIRARRSADAPPPPEDHFENVLNFTPAVVAGLLIVYTLVIAVRGPSMRVREPFSVIMVGVIAGVMAWSWWAGLRRDPRDARRLGAASGVVTAVLFAVAAILLFGRHVPAVPTIKQVILFALSWGLYGFAGGLALDWRGPWRPGVRAGIGVGAAVLALGLINWLFDRSFPWGENVFLAAGVGAGLALIRPGDGFIDSGPGADVSARALKATLPG